MGDKSAENIINAINQSKKNNLNSFLHGLGIKNVGQNASKILENKFNGNIKNIIKATKNELVSIDDVGDVMAESIVSFFSDNKNIVLIERCINSGLKFNKVNKNKTTNIISEKSFVFTGSLNNISRKEAQELVESFGAICNSSVSNKTDYVVAGENAGSKLIKAQSLNLEILSEFEFNELIKKL